MKIASLGRQIALTDVEPGQVFTFYDRNSPEIGMVVASEPHLANRVVVLSAEGLPIVTIDAIGASKPVFKYDAPLFVPLSFPQNCYGPSGYYAAGMIAVTETKFFLRASEANTIVDVANGAVERIANDGKAVWFDKWAIVAQQFDKTLTLYEFSLPT